MWSICRATRKMLARCKGRRVPGLAAQRERVSQGKHPDANKGGWLLGNLKFPNGDQQRWLMSRMQKASRRKALQGKQVRIASSPAATERWTEREILACYGLRAEDRELLADWASDGSTRKCLRIFSSSSDFEWLRLWGCRWIMVNLVCRVCKNQ